jgi:hypothetical protein
MDADLETVADALADLADAELHALVDAADEFMLFAAGFMSWVEHLANWEINRRAGLDFPMHPPRIAIPPDEHASSVAAAAMLRERFAQSPRREGDPIVGLFEAVVDALGGPGAAARW